MTNFAWIQQNQFFVENFLPQGLISDCHTGDPQDCNSDPFFSDLRPRYNKQSYCTGYASFRATGTRSYLNIGVGSLSLTGLQFSGFFSFWIPALTDWNQRSANCTPGIPHCGVGSRQYSGQVIPGVYSAFLDRGYRQCHSNLLVQGVDSPTASSIDSTDNTIHCLISRSLALTSIVSDTVSVAKYFDPAAFIGPRSGQTSVASIDLCWKPVGAWIQGVQLDSIQHFGVGSCVSHSLARQYSFCLFLFLQRHGLLLTWTLVNLLLLATALELFLQCQVLTHTTQLGYNRRIQHLVIDLLGLTRLNIAWNYNRHSSETWHLSDHLSLASRRGHKPGPKSGRAVRLVFLGLLLSMSHPETTSHFSYGQLHGGEGYGLCPWEPMRANFGAQQLQNLLEAKIHGPPPTMGSGPEKFPATMSNLKAIHKRSFKRAFARSLRDGVAWYRGQCVSPTDFPRHMPAPKKPCPSRPAGVPPTMPARRTLTHRLNIVQYNVGGLSSHKLEELKAWGLHIHADVLILVETRWGFSSEWSDANWHALHSGTSEDMADGILILVRGKTIQASQIGSAAILPGRLLHLRLHYRQRACDIICCYNFMDDRTTKRMQLRQNFWSTLDQYVGYIPNRNSLLIAGDFNCSVAADPPHVGTSDFTWQDRHRRGPQHRDMQLFSKILHKHQLTILNGWDASNGPTFHTDLAASRIDFFLMRIAEADGLAKTVKYMNQADVIPLSGAVHIPLMCSMKKFHFSYDGSPSFSGFTYRQRQQCRLDWRSDTPSWNAMLQSTRSIVEDLHSTSQAEMDEIQRFHDAMGPCFHSFYPARHPRIRNHAGPHQDLIQQKWALHRQIKATKSLTLHSIFHVWKCSSRYAKLQKEHQKSTKTLKQQRFFDLLHSVQTAAACHDSFAVHQIISQYTPKQPKRKIQLRNDNGTPASPEEALQMTKAFIETIWSGPATVNIGVRDPPGVPITVQDIERELHHLPHNKSVAKPFLPALVVKMHASIIAPWIHNLLTAWWSTPEPYIPAEWKRAWVTLIPKPHKSPCKVSHLRCIALQEPLGKCVIGALTSKLQSVVGERLQQWPQYAFLPHRSTSDAIRRVAAHCDEVRCLVRNQRRSAHQRAAHVDFFNCCGGIQIFLDVERAFDQLPRTKLFQYLDTLHDVPALTTILAQWHSQTDYCLEQGGQTLLIPTGCGVRQGCRAAPLLWNCFLDQFFLSTGHGHLTGLGENAGHGLCRRCSPRLSVQISLPAET